MTNKGKKRLKHAQLSFESVDDDSLLPAAQRVHS